MPIPYNPLDANARQAWIDAQRTGAVGAPGGINPLSGMQAPPQQPWMNALQAASMVPIPGVSDVLGLAGDAQMYATDPSSRTPLNYSLSALGALPFIPGITVFHSGPKKLTSIDPKRLQARDYGFYGKGFYTSERPSKGFGNKITEIEIDPAAKILDAGLLPEKNPQLARSVRDWYLQSGMSAATQRGKITALQEEADHIMTDPLAYKNAVDKFAEANGYDVVKYGQGEVVIKNTKVASIKK